MVRYVLLSKRPAVRRKLTPIYNEKKDAYLGVFFKIFEMQ